MFQYDDNDIGVFEGIMCWSPRVPSQREDIVLPVYNSHYKDKTVFMVFIPMEAT